MKAKTSLLLAAACVAALTPSASAVVVYREVFGNTSNNQPTTTIGWTSYRTGSQVLQVGSGAGHQQTENNVGQTQSATNVANGFIYAGTSTPAQYFTYTDEYNGTVPLTTSNLDTISFWRNGVAATYRIALQIDSVWYISGDSFTPSSASNWDAATQLVWGDFQSANWTTFSDAADFTNPAAANLSLAADFDQLLPDGTVTAFGIWFDKPADTVRIDTFEITIPEPSGLVLASLGLGLALIRRRR